MLPLIRLRQFYTTSSANKCYRGKRRCRYYPPTHSSSAHQHPPPTDEAVTATISVFRFATVKDLWEQLCMLT